MKVGNFQPILLGILSLIFTENDNKKTICSIFKRNKSFLNLPVHNGMEFL